VKGPLGELVRWPEYPVGANFQAGVKKNPLICLTPKHRSKAWSRSWLFSHGLWCRCVWVGQRLGGFLDLPLQVEFLLCDKKMNVVLVNSYFYSP
jgi:hypothetical protein